MGVQVLKWRSRINKMVPARICHKAHQIIQMGLILPWCMARGTGTKAMASPDED